MDRLREDDEERARQMSPSEKAIATFDLMAAGIAFHRAGLKTRFPEETEEQLDARLREWLARDD